MPLYLSPVCNGQTFDANGDPLTGGQIETYLAGSSTQAATYTDNTGSTPQSNPIILDTLGFPTLGAIWLTGGLSYKFVVKNAAGVVLRTIDNISGINDASVSQSEWVESGFVPTYINATSFSVPGDQTTILQINRRVRTQNTAGLIYSTISNSVFAAGVTTVTLLNDSGTLDAGLSTVAYALLSATNSSVPGISATRFTMTTGRALGRVTGGTGAVEELTPTQVSNSLLLYASNAQAQAGSATNLPVNPANLNAVVLGMGQNWQNVLVSRAQGVTYTNSTGRTIGVAAVGTVVPTGTLLLTVDGATLQAFNNPAGVNTTLSVIALINPGSTYSISGSSSISTWRELR